MIIDSHVHITTPEIIEECERHRKEEPHFDLLCSSPKNEFATYEEAVIGMDESGVDRAVVFGFGFRSMDLCRRANDYTIEAVNRYPDRLIGYAVVNPKDRSALAELERCRRAGLRGLGELFPAGQGFDLAEERRMEDLCHFCRDQGWPLLVHLNEPVGHHYPGKTDDTARDGAHLAERFPGVTIIFAHLGGGLCFYELMPELRSILKNVYYDTAAVPFLFDGKVYDGLKAIGLLAKILLGSDFPLLPVERYLKQLEQTGLNEEEKESILGGNLGSILGLD